MMYSRPLRRQDSGAVPLGPVPEQFLRHDLDPAVDLRPREGFGKPRRVDVVVDEGVSHILGLLGRSVSEQGRNCRVNQ